jgi:hypothetical protein
LVALTTGASRGALSSLPPPLEILVSVLAFGEVSVVVGCQVPPGLFVSVTACGSSFLSRRRRRSMHTTMKMMHTLHTVAPTAMPLIAPNEIPGLSKRKTQKRTTTRLT